MRDQENERTEMYMGECCRGDALPVGLKYLLREGTSLRELVHKFRGKTLMLLKLLLLQRRVSYSDNLPCARTS